MISPLALRNRWNRPGFLAMTLFCACLGLSHGLVSGQSVPGVPDRTVGVGVDEKLGNEISLGLQFKDELGRPCKLSDFIKEGRPVLLSLNYSGCPGLCVAQLDGVVRGLEGMDTPVLGKDFDLISISVDPKETPERAMGTKKKYTKGLTGEHLASGWHFLTGSTDSIFKIADQVGFRYTYDAEHDRFNHVAMAVAISPKGKVTRYLYDVAFEPATMRMSLLEASEGTIGTPLDSFILWCMHFDANENRYSADARKLLSLAAGVFVVLVLGCSIPFWIPRKGVNNAELAAVTEEQGNVPGESRVTLTDVEPNESAASHGSDGEGEKTANAEVVGTGSSAELG